MKKVFSFAMGLALALGCAFSAEAQDRNLKFNLGAGVAFPKAVASVEGFSGAADLKTTPYVYGGLDYALPSNSQFHIEAGLQWMMLGIKNLDSESALILPVSVRYQVSKTLPLSFGAGFYGLKVLEEGSELDFGLLLKARYDITHRFFAQMQYNLGLKNHSGHEEFSQKINSFQIGVGLAF